MPLLIIGLLLLILLLIYAISYYFYNRSNSSPSLKNNRTKNSFRLHKKNNYNYDENEDSNHIIYFPINDTNHKTPPHQK